MLTGNDQRTAGQVDDANPRPDNRFGHIIEIIEPDGDFAAAQSTWSILVRCGDPAAGSVGAIWGPDTSEDGWFGYPDNVAIDRRGNLWVATDGLEQPVRCTSGLWTVAASGSDRGRSRLFFRAPTGGEVTGPCFSPDERTLFLSIQHPAADGLNYPPHGRPSTFADPSTRWPDFDPAMPPRSAVMMIRRRDGGAIRS